MASRASWIHPPLIYIGLCIAVAVWYLRAHVRLERAAVAALEPRRRALEFSLVTTICTCFFFGHYYYLIALLIPLTVLLVRYVAEDRRGALALWGLTYFLLGAFIVPIGLLSRVSGYDVWAMFTRYSIFWYGEVLLMGLLLTEYRRLATRA